MSRGYVYILTNEAMPGLVKIGKTTRSVEQRAAELTHTGIPFPFDIADQVYSPDCSELEGWVHGVLAESRINAQREFFLCDTAKASKILHQAHEEQASVWLNEFLPSHTIHRHDLIIDESAIYYMAEELKISVAEVVEAYHFLTPNDIANAKKNLNEFTLRQSLLGKDQVPE